MQLGGGRGRGAAAPKPLDPHRGEAGDMAKRSNTKTMSHQVEVFVRPRRAGAASGRWSAGRALTALASLILVTGLIKTAGASSADVPSSVSNLCHLDTEQWPEQLLEPPILCGSNAFRAAPGASALRIRVPEISPPPTVEDDEAHIKLRLQGGSFAFFGMNGLEDCSIPGVDVCMQASAFLVPAWGAITASLVGTGEVRPGIHELYFVTDGELTVTLNVDGLSGEMELSATGDVDAELRDLPRNCPATDCTNVGYGGLARTSDEKGYAASVAYSRVPGFVGSTEVPNWVSSNSIVSCLYPSEIYPTASANPADHPHGCDLLPNDDDPNSGRLFLTRAADPIGTGFLVLQHGRTKAGPVYAGYTAEQFGPMEPGSYHAWAMWLIPGVSCPGGDWFTC